MWPNRRPGKVVSSVAVRELFQAGQSVSHCYFWSVVGREVGTRYESRRQDAAAFAVSQPLERAGGEAEPGMPGVLSVGDLAACLWADHNVWVSMLCILPPFLFYKLKVMIKHCLPFWDPFLLIILLAKQNKTKQPKHICLNIQLWKICFKIPVKNWLLSPFEFSIIPFNCLWEHNHFAIFSCQSQVCFPKNRKSNFAFLVSVGPIWVLSTFLLNKWESERQTCKSVWLFLLGAGLTRLMVYWQELWVGAVCEP